ncbi:sodium:calcium antiporter [Dissulfurispira thermophila]|uniref:Sodium:calcium antiporter n=2 Tax=root TaxID=1 RepID=A0A7G1H2E7_9BACT|nr:sodium:calcium antiporter [Dissulfurispira thermophila]
MILLSAEFFTNGIESLGRRLSLSQAVVGSILAAVGTAMPETILPFVAILMHSGDAAKKIGVGAILGAPFMLSTLAFFLVGVSVVGSFIAKKREFKLSVEVHSMKRDLLFFIAMYSTAIFLPLLIPKSNVFIAIALLIGYIVYAYFTFRGESGDIMHAEELYFKRFFVKNNQPSGLPLIIFQVLFALVIMINSAHSFVSNLEKLSLSWGMNPMLFALLVAPIATELPEKFNSVTWTLKGRDTLAMGNITGAMVFQSTFPVSIGLLFTDWSISGFALFSAILALISAIVAIANIQISGKVSPLTILSGGLFYVIYAVAIIAK